MIYPTYYHFVASIIILYIPFYFIMKNSQLRIRIPLIMFVLGVIYVIIYVSIYDKSYYHIDNVREIMIRFLFMESMLLGAFFRHNDSIFRNAESWRRLLLLGLLVAVFLCAYFVSKLLFSKNADLAQFQIINQFIIFGLLFLIFMLIAALDARLERLPGWCKTCISFIADLTLEIYLVQYVLIALIRPYFSFPLNWIVLTAAIITAAYLLHIISNFLVNQLSEFISNLKSKFIRIK